MKKTPTTSVNTLDDLLSVNAELSLKVTSLQKELELRESELAILQTRLDQYWEFHDDIDYRHLVERIREDAGKVGDVLRALDTGARRQLARLGNGVDSTYNRMDQSDRRLLPTVHSLLRTLDEWK